MSLPLLPGLALAGGGLTVVIDGVRLLYAGLSNGIDSLFNDFYDYWGAANLLNRGGNPYDINALTGVLHTAGLHTEVGGGYSYPLLLAQALRPLALLSPHTAALVFSALSLVALGVASSLILGSLHPLSIPRAVIGGSAIAAFPPLFGSLYFGQVNLLVLVALALAWRLVRPGPWLAVAGAIKLYPLTGFLSHLTRPSRESRTQLLWGGAILATLVLVPQLGAHGSFLGQSGALLAPDPFWTNASVNGLISRLALRGDWTAPPLPGLPTGPAVHRGVRPARGGHGDRPGARSGTLQNPARLALVRVAGSCDRSEELLLERFAPLILTVASIWQLRARQWWPVVLAGVGWLLIQAQSQIDAARETFYRGGPQLTWLSGLALYGAVVIGGALAWQLLACARRPPGEGGTAAHD